MPKQKLNQGLYLTGCWSYDERGSVHSYLSCCCLLDDVGPWSKDHGSFLCPLKRSPRRDDHAYGLSVRRRSSRPRADKQNLGVR